MSKTIYALSSGVPPAAVAIVRISGQKTREILETLCVRTPVSRETLLTKIRNPNTGELIDEALVLWFEGPASFTGEDCGEIHVHGGRAVVNALLNQLSKFDGLRMAEPGEFTKRAFNSGKIDLSMVEGLADLISAETEEQRKFAVRNSTGELQVLCDSWRKQLIRSRAMIEADLDFSDEEDVPGDVPQEVWIELETLKNEICKQLELGNRTERLREGIRIVISGKPNVGKSSLINQIARRNVAIVTSEEGTTRDVLAIHLDLEGFPAMLIDTAGIRESTSEAEQEGVRRAKEQIESADLILHLVDASIGDSHIVQSEISENAATWKVFNKIDLVKNDEIRKFTPPPRVDGKLFYISAKTGKGIEELMNNISEFCRQYWKGTEGAFISRARHRELLTEALKAISSSISAKDKPIELRAEELRNASDQIGRISGRVDTEDLLDVIFNEFCIGK